jgi:hypothetical protein
VSDIPVKNKGSYREERGEGGAGKMAYLERPKQKSGECASHRDSEEPIEIDREKGIVNDGRQDLYDREIERSAKWKVNCVPSEGGTEPRDVVIPGAFSESFY